MILGNRSSFRGDSPSGGKKTRNFIERAPWPFACRRWNSIRTTVPNGMNSVLLFVCGKQRRLADDIFGA